GEGVVAVALGPSVATIPLRPWAKEVKVIAPQLLHLNKLLPAPGGPSSRRMPAGEREEHEEEEALSLHGQVLAWSKDGSVVAVSTPTGGVACLRHLSGACLATVVPRPSVPDGGGSAASLGGGVAGVALRGSLEGGKMEVGLAAVA
ncbi:unnamed protein product, partial [Ectocarpus sp. 4 AP-2014]